jgi:hypothetical protein
VFVGLTDLGETMPAVIERNLSGTTLNILCHIFLILQIKETDTGEEFPFCAKKYR